MFLKISPFTTSKGMDGRDFQDDVKMCPAKEPYNISAQIRSPNNGFALLRIARVLLWIKNRKNLFEEGQIRRNCSGFDLFGVACGRSRNLVGLFRMVRLVLRGFTIRGIER